jgi:hypothetical protein
VKRLGCYGEGSDNTLNQREVLLTALTRYGLFCCFELFGIIRLREGWKIILGAGGSAESPKYDSLLTPSPIFFLVREG